MSPEEFARRCWQSEQGVQTMPSIEELRAKADRFHTKIKRRNNIEYSAGFLVLLGFGYMLLFGPLPWTPPVIPAPIIRLGAGLILVGTAIALWQLHKRTTPLSPPVDGGLHSVLDFRRHELERQKDALNNIFFWYLLPFVPGMVVLLLVPLALSPVIGDASWFTVLGKISFVPLLFGGCWWINKKGAGKLQQEIDEIDALRSQ